jgi:hypothetical protein
LATWFFACDQTNYARWLPVHIRDMLALKDSHPDVHTEFMNGKFTVCKSGHKFSSISIDQCHEQINGLVKGDGGIIGITENDAALNRWSIAGPEVLRMLNEYERNLFYTAEDSAHHEQSDWFQNQFKIHIMKLLDIFDNELIFSETTGKDLIVLCSNMIAHDSVLNTVRTVEHVGEMQFNAFFADRLSDSGSLSVLSPIKRNKFPLFSYKPQSKNCSSGKLKINALKTDCEIFSRLYVACQNRDGDLDNFFRHENQAFPPSLSQNGSLRFSAKSDLLDCFRALVGDQHDFSQLNVDAYVLDGSAVVQMLRPGPNVTFDDYRQVFCP